MVQADSDPFATAFVLAAIAAGDRAASRGAVASPLASRIASVLDRSRTAMADDRAAAVASLAKVLAVTVPESTSLSARARGIVASLVPRELGARWMREAPPPRAGFRTSAALRRTLAGLAETSWRV